MTTMFPDPSVSVVMPVRNEAGAIGDLLDEIEAVLRPTSIVKSSSTMDRSTALRRCCQDGALPACRCGY